jgi:MFS family permease
MNQNDRPAIRRATMGLLLTQSIASAALITSTTVNPIVAAQLSSQEALAGLPSALMLVGASVAAYPAGRLMGRLGRRYGMLIGCAVGLAGTLVCGFAVITSALPIFLAGLLLLGAGRGTLDQGRYAAAEINPPQHRARALSIVIFGGTIGAVLGPGLVAPSSQVAASLGLHDLAGPYFTTGVLLVVAAIVVAILLAGDLRGIARRVAQQFATATTETNPGDVETRNRASLPKSGAVATIFGRPGARTALITMLCAQATMVMMMAIIGLYMTHHEHGLGDVSLVTMVHVLGMYALSPVLGQIVDKVGRRNMIAISATVIAAGCIVAPLSIETPWIALALFLIGLGWSGCYITGSTLLTDALGVNERARVQGANDTLINISSAAGSLSSGILLQVFGFNILSLVGLTVALLPVLALVGNRPPALGDQPSVAR